MCSTERRLILESPKPLCNKESDQDEEGWNEDEYAYIRPTQSCIDVACKNDGFIRYHLMIVGQTYICEVGCLEVCMMLKPHEDHLPLVSKMLAWMHWHYDIT